ncbi:hypothetical protein A0H81_06378 [Grifola frondosa]|uniref:Mediator of RNA polymerase II transcription subunit 4 n=1 Tax=Grifola frondosa TaxID=5627 RepID=A0A1C7MBU8_GRIFR|nr:hypothetical protein A0H81_06378 [Grifola frondosa]
MYSPSPSQQTYAGFSPQSTLAGPSLSQSTYPGLSSQSTVPGLSSTQIKSDDDESAPLSMSEILLDPLDQLQALAQVLFQSLGPPQTRPPPPPSISALLSVDAQLASAIQLTRTHQVRQRKIEQLKDEVLELDRRWREIVSELEEGRRELDEIYQNGNKELWPDMHRSRTEPRAGGTAYKDSLAMKQAFLFIVCALQRSLSRLLSLGTAVLLFTAEVSDILSDTAACLQPISAAIPYPELLAYAQSLSAFTSAPPNMPDLAPGQPPPPLFFPPFPNEEKMRRGHISQEASLGLLGETHSVGKPPTVSPVRSVELPPHLAGPGANPYRPDLRHPQQQIFDFDLDLNPDL